MRIFDIVALKILATLDNDDYITSIAATPDGRHILTSDARKGLKVWNIDLSAL